MKYFCIVFLLFNLCSSAQFYSENKEVSWRGAIATKKSFSNLFVSSKLSGNYTDIDTINGVLLCRLKNYIPKIRSAGYKTGNTATYIQQGFLEATILFKISGDSLIMSVKKMGFTLIEDLPLYGSRGTFVSVDQIALTAEGDFKKSKLAAWKQVSEILEHNFLILSHQLVE